MKLKYYGTAAAEGIPALFCNCDICKKAKELGGKEIRTRSQSIIDDTLLIDFPPDSYMHMIYDGLDLPAIKNIIFTHSHQDHFYGVELVLRTKGYANFVDHTLNIYGNPSIAECLDSAVETYTEEIDLNNILTYHEVIEFVPFVVDGYTVTALLANHDKTEKCLFYIIEKDGKSILYANDTGIFPQATWEYLQGKHFDLVSADCTTGIRAEGSNHMGFPDNLIVRKRLIDMGCITEKTKYVLNHFSHNGRILHSDLCAMAEPQGFLVAYDGFEIEI